MDPFATVGLYRSNKLRQCDCWSDNYGEMKMIANTVDRQRDSFVIPDNSRDVFAYSIYSFSGQEPSSFLSRKHYVINKLCVRH